MVFWILRWPETSDNAARGVATTRRRDNATPRQREDARLRQRDAAKPQDFDDATRACWDFFIVHNHQNKAFGVGGAPPRTFFFVFVSCLLLLMTQLVVGHVIDGHGLRGTCISWLDYETAKNEHVQHVQTRAERARAGLAAPSPPASFGSHPLFLKSPFGAPVA